MSASGSRTLWLLLLLHVFPAALTFTLRIIHTNDVHARFDETSERSNKCTDKLRQKGGCYGGYARLVHKVKELRSQDPNHTLVLDAGDQYTGTPWFKLYGGNLTAIAENLLHYDVSTLGNHEFDKGVSGLLPFLSGVDHPVVCCNIDLSGEPQMEPYVNSSVVLSRSGVKIGVIGFITSDTASISNVGSQLRFQDELEPVRREVRRLQAQNVSILVGLSHAGLDRDRQLAREVSGLDLIVGGHSHSFLWTGQPPSLEEPVADYPVVEENVSGQTALVVQAYAYSKYLGFIQVEFDDQGNVQNWTGSPILLNSSVPQDNATLRALGPYARGVEQLRRTVVGDSHVLLQGHETHCRKEECSMGNVVADALLWWWQRNATPTAEAWTNVSVAVINGGGVRTSIQQGPVTAEDVIGVLPFDNFLQAIDLPGTAVRGMFEKSASKLSRDGSHGLFGGFLQVSGVRVTYDVSRPVGERVVELLLLCASCPQPAFQPLRDELTYRIAIPDFTANGGDGYDVINNNKKNIDTSGKLLSEVLQAYVQSHRPVYTGVEGRTTIRTEDPCHTSSRGAVGAAWRARATTPAVLGVAALLLAVLLLQ